MARLTKADGYRETLRSLDAAAWDAFMLAHCGLPGPRANLELLQVVADEGDEACFRRWLAIDAGRTPPNTPDEFLPACGAVGLGRLAATGHRDVLGDLRRHASDPRWRVREGVAMGLQRLGAIDMPSLLAEMERWSTGGWLERRAVVAALCEPALLRDPAYARSVLDLLDALTRSVSAAAVDARCDPGYRVLRQALGYGWSVAVAALPHDGQIRLERWCASVDSDVRWIMRENLRKSRLKRLDSAWAERCAQKTA